ncbi:MAG: tetratricopeptide repeat protein [Lachnospiraceae bacterium]|nr:tetratricopeptide repeat protein [Lachnospiraceae bacterium]
MLCYNCGNELTKDTSCPHCGVDVKVYKKIIMASNFYYNQGLERAGVRDLSGAMESLKKSLRFYKRNTQARNLLGLVMFEMGETVSALGEWVISKNLQAKNNEAGRYLDEIQKNPSKLSDINQTIKKYNQALLYCRQDSKDLAIIQLKKVLALNPKLVKGHQLLALLYIQERKYDQAKRCLRAAMKIDSSNTVTMRYMKATNQGLHAVNPGKKKKKEDDAIAYKSGNDLIIRPTRLKDTSGFATILSIIIGIVIGVLVTGFLVVPGIRQKAKADANTSVVQANETIASKNQEITGLENQIAELNRQLTNEQDASAQSKDSIASYEMLLQAYQAFADEKITEAGDLLVQINQEDLSDTAKAIYDNISGVVDEQYLQAAYDEGYAAYNSRDYEKAKENLEKVVTKDEAFENGNAIYYLAQTYRNLEENEKAAEYYQKVIDGYPGTERASNATRYLEQMQDVQ